jgi:hypothetical protein
VEGKKSEDEAAGKMESSRPPERRRARARPSGSEARAREPGGWEEARGST